MSNWSFIQFLAGQAGAVTGSIPNEAGRASVRHLKTLDTTAQDSGVGLVVLVALGLACAIGYYLVCGYMVSARIVSDYLGSDSRGGEHDWWLIATYAGLGFLGVAVAGRLLGIAAGVVASAIPAIPLLQASKGGVGFWWIVNRSGAEPADNAGAAGMAALGLFLLHAWVVWLVRWREERFGHQVVRWMWVSSPLGAILTIGLLLIGYRAVSLLKAASAAF